MFSVSFTIEIIVAVIMMTIMHISMNVTNGDFFKNVAIYAILNTIIMIILGLRGIGILLMTAILFFIEGLPLIWIMQKIYDSVSFKFFIVITIISRWIVNSILSFLFSL